MSGASWHDEYKDSAYVFVGGLHFDLTEGDVITIFSQYGEVMDLHMPRDKDTGKTKGFGFLMYEDQRSTVLAVDNLNGAKVLERTLRVDHVKNYKQPKVKGEDGEWQEPEDQSFNARPQMIDDGGADSDSSASTGADIDPEDPMRDYLLQKRREEKALTKPKKHKSKGKHKDETPEERKARKARKKEKKVKSEGMRAVESLLSNLGRRDLGPSTRSRSRSPGGDRPRRGSRSPTRYRESPPGRRERASDDLDYEARKKRSRYSDDDRSRDVHRQGSDSRSSKRTRDFD